MMPTQEELARMQVEHDPMAAQGRRGFLEEFSRAVVDMFPDPVHPSECATTTDARLAQNNYEEECRRVVEARNRFVSENSRLISALLPPPIFIVNAKVDS